MKVFYDAQVLTQCININTICPNYIHELKTNNEIAFIMLSSRVGQDRKCHRFNTVKLKAIKLFKVVYKRFPITHLLMQGSCAICNNF